MSKTNLRPTVTLTTTQAKVSLKATVNRVTIHVFPSLPLTSKQSYVLIEAHVLNKTQHLFCYQCEAGNNMNGHPVFRM